MKTPIAILSAFALAVPFASAEQGEKGKPEGKRPNPKEHFEKMDADDSGTVSLEEFKSTPRAKENPEKAEEIFKKMDADTSGDITFAEMIEAHKKRKEGGEGDRPNPKEHFKKMDADDNGTVSLEEFKSTPRAKENPEKAAEIFKKMDADSSGDITFEEMIQAHKKHRGNHRKGGPGQEGDGGEQEEKTGPAVD